MSPTAYPEPTADIVAFCIDVPGLPTSKLSTIIVAPTPEPFVVVGKAAVAPLAVVVITEAGSVNALAVANTPTLLVT